MANGPTRDEMAKGLAAERDELAGKLRALGNSEAVIALSRDHLKLVHADEAEAFGFPDLSQELHREVGD